jgi:citrate lyase subunit beta/citryl-CoA lyase
MGFDGKTLIHPAQVPVANEVFAPDKEEVEWARRIVEAFASGANSGLEVMRLSGRMVERLHERQAKRTLALADAIAALDEWAKVEPQAAPRRLRSGAALAGKAKP